MVLGSDRRRCHRDDEPPALNVASQLISDGYGGAVQLTLKPDVAGRKNRLAIGFAADFGRTGFLQSQQSAGITPERETPGEGPFAQTVDVANVTRQLGLYATDTISMAASMRFTRLQPSSSRSSPRMCRA